MNVTIPNGGYNTILRSGVVANVTASPLCLCGVKMNTINRRCSPYGWNSEYQIVPSNYKSKNIYLLQICICSKRYKSLKEKLTIY